MLRSALLILSGNATASAILMARNLVIAWLIPVADYGIAATLALAMAAVEMVSSFGLQQQIVQAKQGDDPDFQDALQGFQMLRGVGAGLLMLAIAWPMAVFMDTPQAMWGYAALALVPVLNAAQHFDIHRLNRGHRFGPLILTNAVPAALALAVIWPLDAVWGDWRVMLGSILVQAATAAVTSHLVAERRFRLRLDRAVTGGALRFGWPLLINAVLMYLVFHGDKLIVGRLLGIEALAVFSMGVNLTLTPTLVLGKSAQTLFLPGLARAEGAAFQAQAQATVGLHLGAAAAMVWGAMVAGPAIVGLILGPDYAALAGMITAMTAAQGLRVLKTGPAIVALARGQTGNAMLANAARVASLPVAWIMAQNGGGVWAVLAVAILAEALGAALSIWLVIWRCNLRLPGLARDLALFLAVLGAALLPDLAGWPRLWLALAALVPLAILLQRGRGLWRGMGHRPAGHAAP